MRLLILLLAFGVMGESSAQNEARSILLTPPYQAGGTASSPWYLDVRNQSDSPASAVAISFLCRAEDPGKPKVVLRIDDGLYGPYSKKVLARGDAWGFPAYPPAECSISGSAILFSDGSSDGEPILVSEVAKHRRDVSEGLASVTSIFKGIETGEVGAAREVEHLASILQARSPKSTQQMLKPDGFAEQLEFASNLLRDDAWRNDPKVDALMVNKNLSRDRAVAALWRPRFMEWQANLASAPEVRQASR